MTTLLLWQCVRWKFIVFAFVSLPLCLSQLCVHLLNRPHIRNCLFEQCQNETLSDRIVLECECVECDFRIEWRIRGILDPKNNSVFWRAKWCHALGGLEFKIACVLTNASHHHFHLLRFDIWIFQSPFQWPEMWANQIQMRLSCVCGHWEHLQVILMRNGLNGMPQNRSSSVHPFVRAACARAKITIFSSSFNSIEKFSIVLPFYLIIVECTVVDTDTCDGASCAILWCWLNAVAHTKCHSSSPCNSQTHFERIAFNFFN